MQTSITADPTLLPSTSTNYPSCDVFISHRGPDTKDTFASHLFHRLLSCGLQPFLDREVLEKGDYIDPQIESAIRTASFHITIFSPKYADSKWCLDELVSILKTGATIIPVFYKVKPSELRWTGRYARALSIHEEKGRYDYQRIENWRKALYDVSSIVGFELETYNGDEGKLLDSVIQCVLKKRTFVSGHIQAPLYVARHATGLQQKVEDLEKIMLLQKEKSREAQVLGIVGLGGAGKTTLAKELFNRKSCYFNKSCFLFDCRETARLNSINYLQSKLLEGVGFTQSTAKTDSISEGIERLRRYLSACHTLVVLDDVDHVHQLEAILPIKDILQQDSLILVTSRYKDVLTSSGIPESSIYMLRGLGKQHSQQLLCSYAFLQPYPLPGFENLVDEFSEACHGLPLSLKVFGGLLSQKKDTSYWIGQLDKLRQIKLPDEIQDRLKISYDGLVAEEKQIFLDIACYFIGEEKDKAIRIWDGSDWNGSVGFLNLESKCLVETDIKDNTIKMHDHLRDLGRNLAAQENSLVRHWRTTEDVHDLWQQSHVIREVRGIRTVPRIDNDYEALYGESEEEMSWFNNWCDEVFGNCLRKLIDPTPYRFRMLQLLASENVHVESILKRVQSPNLIWLRWNFCPFSCLPTWIPMKNLRVLEVTGRKLKTLWRTESQTPLELRELIIQAPLSKFPKSIGQLQHIGKIPIWLGEGVCPNLQYLYISICHNLVDVGELPPALIKLHLFECSQLRKTEGLSCNLTKLRELYIINCRELEELPSLEGLVTLEELRANECVKLKRVQGLGQLAELRILSVCGCKRLEEVASVENLRLLEKVYVVDCPRLQWGEGVVEKLGQRLDSQARYSPFYSDYPARW